MLDKKLNPPNPTGKGGFIDNPQNRASGTWNKDETISYQYNKLIRLTTKQMQSWLKENPDDARTVAQDIAYHAVVKARLELPYLKEVTDRIEGKPMQYSEVNANVQTTSISNEMLEELDQMYEKNSRPDTEDNQ